MPECKEMCGNCEFYGDQYTTSEGAKMPGCPWPEHAELPWCPPYRRLMEIRMETKKELAKVSEFASKGVAALEKQYEAQRKGVDKQIKLGVIGVLKNMTDSFSDGIVRGAADLAAHIHESMDPRDDVVVVLGNCASAFKSMMLAVVQDLENDLDWGNRNA